MEEEPLTFGDELVAGLERAVALGERLPEERYRLSGAELSRILPLLDRCRAVMAGDVFAVTCEAEARGEVAMSQAGSTGQWVAEHCADLTPAEAGVIGKAVRRLAPARFTPVREAVSTGRISAPAGLTVRSEFDAMEKLLVPDAEEAVIEGLVAMGRREGSAGVRRLRPGLLARYGLADKLQEEQDRVAGCASLGHGRDLGSGLWDYRLRLNTEQRAALEAAIGPLSTPQPCREGAHRDANHHLRDADGVGCRDTRSVEQRRAEALVEVCRRATAVAPATTASGAKAAVFVTIRWQDLQDGTGVGVVFGGLDGGAVLGPETVRRMACDAGIVPVVLGSRGEILDVGRTLRLFTAGQQKALWLRDRHCTFDGCTVPAHWCHAHHVTHWADGGATDLDNAALLCPRHHTIVHRDRLTATVAPDGVGWDRVPGSYDRAQQEPRSGQPHPRIDADPPDRP